MCHDNEEWYKIEEELNCRCKSDMNLSYKIWPEHSKSLKKIF